MTRLERIRQRQAVWGVAPNDDLRLLLDVAEQVVETGLGEDLHATCDEACNKRALYAPLAAALAALTEDKR